MRKLIVAEFLTLDGVMEASEQWQPPYVSEDVAEAIQASIHASEAMLLGRVTYELFAVQALMQAGLVDAYWLLLHPLVRGRGKRHFADGIGLAGLKLIESTAFRSGAVLLRYEPDGKAA